MEARGGTELPLLREKARGGKTQEVAPLDRLRPVENGEPGRRAGAEQTGIQGQLPRGHGNGGGLTGTYTLARLGIIQVAGVGQP